VFSRIVLERLDSRYVVTQRETFYQSDILLTPYNDKEEIDAEKLGAFIDQQYKDANVDPAGDRYRRADPHRRRGPPPQCAQDRRDFRRPGRQAGGGERRRQPGDGDGRLRLRRRGAFDPRQLDGDECRLSAAARRRSRCALEGKVIALTGHRRRRAARLRRRRRQDQPSRGSRPPLRQADLGLISSSATLSPQDAPRDMADHMADRLFEAMKGGDPTEGGTLLRLDPLAYRGKVDEVTFSGGVSEFIYGREKRHFWRPRPVAGRGDPQAGGTVGVAHREYADQGIRATVVGASQYTTQVSGSTIFVAPLETVPLRNIAGDRAQLPLGDEIDRRRVADPSARP
jgi:ethanolamine utilization protein EutA